MNKKIQIKIVDKEKKINKIDYVFFSDNTNTKKIKKEFVYKKNDVVFFEMSNNGELEIKECHSYCKLMKYLDKINEKDGVNKSLLLNKFTNCFNLDKQYNLKEKERKILENIKKNNKLINASLEEIYDWISFPAKITDKLIVGLGNPSVFETDITLHHTYGIPYIPGQALKGMFRNYIIQEYPHDCQKECEKDAINDLSFSLIFGSKNNEGKNTSDKVIFMDSFPCGDFKIKRDIMTPHHVNYYKENKSKEPLDLDEPNPIHFLTVENNTNKDKGLEFEINIAIDKSISNEKWNANEKTIEEFILENIIDALNFHGIGAKTSVGYGYFDIDKEKNEQKLKNEKQLREAEKLKKEFDLRKKLEEEEAIRKELEKEQNFKEATKNMSELEIELYRIDEIEGEKNEAIMNLYKDKIDLLEEEEQIKLALFVKKYLENIEKWEYKIGKNGKCDKKSKRVEKICEILKISKPFKKSI